MPVFVRSIFVLGLADVSKIKSSLRLHECVSRDGFDPEVNSVCLGSLKAMKAHPDDVSFDDLVERSKKIEKEGW